MMIQKSKGLYIHIPFCLTKCPYCDFYSVKCENALMDDYKNTVIEEIITGNRCSEFADKSDLAFDTVYFGGGTPSAFGEKRINEILTAIKENYNLSENCEITVECNPSSCSEEFFGKIKKCGVNRISLGMQSAVECERRKLGRLSDRQRVEDSVKWAKKCGFENISIDIMLGVEGQTIESLDETVDFCLSLDIPHISAYMLKIEENTVFAKRIDKMNLPNEDEVCDLYLHLIKRLEEQGINQYEISNFAKKGFESRHNLKYWQCEEYLGLGSSAHSFINGKRFFFERNIDGFINGEKPVFDSDGGDVGEYIMLALRLSTGLKFDEFKKNFGYDIPHLVLKQTEELENTGLIVNDTNSIRLTKQGFLLSNTIICKLLDKL